jgi:hypothetical protein
MVVVVLMYVRIRREQCSSSRTSSVQEIVGGGEKISHRRFRFSSRIIDFPKSAADMRRIFELSPRRACMLPIEY